MILGKIIGVVFGCVVIIILMVIIAYETNDPFELETKEQRENLETALKWCESKDNFRPACEHAAWGCYKDYLYAHNLTEAEFPVFIPGID